LTDVLLPCAHGTKECRVPNWNADPPPPMSFGTDDNTALRLDAPHVDIDLDCAEARVAAPLFLPPTDRRHGRPSLGVPSHYWFLADNAKPEKFCDVVKVGGAFPVLLEIRCGRTQYTLIPPSRVPIEKTGTALEVLRWFAEGAASRYSYKEIRLAACYCAIACLLGRHCAPDGTRWEFYEALAGFLLDSLGLSAKTTTLIIETVAKIVGDTDTKPRPAEWVRRTEDRLKQGQPCIGAPKVAELIGEHGPAVVAQIRRWLGHGDALVLNPNDPLPSAREFVARHHTVQGVACLRHQAGVFFGYTDEASAYLERDEAAVRADVYAFLEGAKRRADDGVVPFQPTRSKVENMLDALRAVCNLPTSIVAPAWLKSGAGLAPMDMLAYAGGLLHIPTRTRYRSTPHFFTFNAIGFAYDHNAPTPTAWLMFLHTLWPEDPQSVEALQEIFGYCLTPDTRFQKIFMLVGPPRSGKGLTGRVLQRLVGDRNTCSPTLGAFGRDFGKQVLVGKTLAVISDARISGRTDTATVAETLLSISGEDTQTIERKFLPDWNGKLPTRFVVLTNELPRITDVSGALAKRFIVLALSESFYGREDLGLFERFLPELPGILNWALEGRDRLYGRGHFVQPESAKELMREFEDLGSPEATFLRTHTQQQAGAVVSQRDLFEAWQRWCHENGRDKPGTAQTFGRNVRATLPWIKTRQLGERGHQERCWEGLLLTMPPEPPGSM
jgi:putative DNA primase/helicase